MRKKGIILVIFLFCILLCGIAGYSMEKNIEVALDSELGNRCAYIINDAVNYALSKNIDFAEIVLVEKNSQGVISYVSLDNLMLNRFSMDVMEVLEDEVRGIANIRMGIPAGNLLSSRLLSGRGPTVNFEAYSVGGLGIEFEPKLSDAGINQVLFHMDLIVETDMAVVFGFRKFQKEILRKVPVCDIVIVGNVPETYANLPAETDFLNLVP